MKKNGLSLRFIAIGAGAGEYFNAHFAHFTAFFRFPFFFISSVRWAYFSVTSYLIFATFIKKYASFSPDIDNNSSAFLHVATASLWPYEAETSIRDRCDANRRKTPLNTSVDVASMGKRRISQRSQKRDSKRYGHLGECGICLSMRGIPQNTAFWCHFITFNKKMFRKPRRWMRPGQRG